MSDRMDSDERPFWLWTEAEKREERRKRRAQTVAALRVLRVALDAAIDGDPKTAAVVCSSASSLLPPQDTYTSQAREAAQAAQTLGEFFRGLAQADELEATAERLAAQKGTPST